MERVEHGWEKGVEAVGRQGERREKAVGRLAVDRTAGRRERREVRRPAV